MAQGLNNDPRSDAQLLEAAAGGDTDAFEILYLRHRDWAIRLARRYTPDDALALDITHDAFMHLLEDSGRIKLRTRLPAYLYPVIKHRALAFKRRDKRLKLTDSPPTQTAAASDQSHETADQLRQSLDRLPPEAREVLLMRTVDQMSTQEVARALNIPTGTVKSRLHKALQILRHDERTQRYFDLAPNPDRGP